MTNNRWAIAVAGVVIQIALGAVYAWSVFRTPLASPFGWSISEVTLTFTISIFVLGIAAFFGGIWLNRQGPRVVAVVAGFLYALGIFLASFSGRGLWWLYLTYSVIGGTGLGRLIGRVGVLSTFAYLGTAYLVTPVVAGLFMKNPPEGWRPPGWTPDTKHIPQRSTHNYTLSEALGTWQWWVLWLILFLNTSAGISVISQEAPMFQELARVSVVVAAGMVGIVSIGNALGRSSGRGCRIRSHAGRRSS